MRKYEKYVIATDMGEYEIDSYRDALSIFRKHKDSATLWGVNYMGEYCVILAK